MEVTIAKAEYEALQRENATLRHELAELKRLIFGSRSEKFRAAPVVSEQLDLGFAGETSPAPPPAVVEEPISYRRRARSPHPGRAALPQHLPVEEIVIEPQADTTGLVRIGEEITETLDYRPGVLLKRIYIRPKYARPAVLPAPDAVADAVAEYPRC